MTLQPPNQAPTREVPLIDVCRVPCLLEHLCAHILPPLLGQVGQQLQASRQARQGGAGQGGQAVCGCECECEWGMVG